MNYLAIRNERRGLVEHVIFENVSEVQVLVSQLILADAHVTVWFRESSLPIEQMCGDYACLKERAGGYGVTKDGIKESCSCPKCIRRAA